MARSLRSNSRWKKLNVQHFQQINRVLRVRLNNHTETRIDNFKQTEFLSLFGLYPIHTKSTISERKAKKNAEIGDTKFVCTEKYRHKRRIIRLKEDDTNNIGLETSSKLRKILGNHNFNGIIPNLINRQTISSNFRY